MYSDFSIQQAVIREAVVYAELESTPLLIKLDARSGASFGQICLHLENKPLALALAKAINETLKAFEATPVPEGHRCDKCDTLTDNDEDDYGEFVCDGCLQNKAEAAYERHCEAFHDGGATQFNTLQQQQIEARRLK